jgi:hypothetical protein
MSRVTSIAIARRGPSALPRAALRVNTLACGESTPSVPPDQTNAIRLPTSSGETPRCLRQQGLIRRGGVAAGEIVRAAIAFRLADQGDDLLSLHGTAVDQLCEFRHIVGGRHRDLVYADLHRFLTLASHYICGIRPRRMAQC